MTFLKLDNLQTIIDRFETLTINQILSMILSDEALSFRDKTPPFQLISELNNLRRMTNDKKPFQIICMIAQGFFLLPSYTAFMNCEKMLKSKTIELNTQVAAFNELKNSLDEKMNKVEESRLLLSNRQRLLDVEEEVIQTKIASFNNLKLEYETIKEDVNTLNQEKHEIQYQLSNIGLDKYNTVLKTYEFIKKSYKDLSKIVSTTISKADYMAGTLTKEALDILHDTLIRKNSMATKNEKFVFLPEYMSNSLNKMERLILERRPKPTGNTGLDNLILATYSHFTQETNFRVASWFRAELSKTYHTCYPKTFSKGSKTLMFWCTYIDPLNLMSKEELQDYLTLTERERRVKYFKMYKLFDKETGNCISMFRE